MQHLLSIYRAQFRITFATQLQYRAELLIWLIAMILEPVIYLVVWSAVSATKGTPVDGFGPREFAAYFIVSMLVNFVTFDWHMWEMEFRIRDGSFSPLLLRPVHPIHADLASNITYKILMLAVMLPVTVLLSYVFDAQIHPTGATLVYFFAALLLAWVLRSLLEWTLALVAFWTTRVMAINRIYFSANLFLSGRMAPLVLLPATLGAIAAYLPFRWTIAFPTELLLGRIPLEQAPRGLLIQCVWIVAGLLMLVVVWRRGVRRYAGVGA
jgi:ABC-2 type transport system permease protein